VEAVSASILDDLSTYEAGRAVWYWRLGEMEGSASEVKRHFLAHRFIDTEPACGEPSGLEQWSKAPASVPRCGACERAG
jgi:hypothetical protein